MMMSEMMTLGELLEMYQLDLNAKVDIGVIDHLHTVGGVLADIIEGWWDDDEKARARLNQFISALKENQSGAPPLPR
jgi:hypothetical protein